MTDYFISKNSDPELWDKFVDQSENGTIFHKYQWLKAAEKESRTALHLLTCDKPGEGTIALFPVFILKKFFLRILLSPPNGCAIQELGPVFLPGDKKPQKTETDQTQSIKSFLDYIHRNLQPDFWHINTNHYDVRSFTWHGFSAKPLYTYVLSLKDENTNFEKNLDKRIRNRIKKVKNDESLELRNGNPNDIHQLISELKQKYKKQNRVFKPSFTYFNELLEITNDEGLHCSAVYHNNKFLTGFLLLKHKKTLRSWLGGVNSENCPAGVIEYLQWHNISQAKADGIDIYERMGANTPHISASKAKYGLSPRVYYALEKKNFKGELFFALYNFFMRKNK